MRYTGSIGSACMVGVTYACVVYTLVQMVALDEEILKCMMDKNLSSVKTFVQLITDIKVEGFTPKKTCNLRKVWDFLQIVQELKSEVAQKKKHEQ